VRADRLLSLLLMLRRRGRLTAGELAAELEVSVRTVLRDVEALSAAGVPVYAERGRRGGIVLLPGWSTDLTGLTSAEAVALATAGSRATSEALGMGPAFSSAMRKIVAGMPEVQRASAQRGAERVLVTANGWRGDPEPEGALAEVQRAVFADRRLRLRYAASGGAVGERTVDPIGLVHADGHWYLLATSGGADRTYRVSRVQEATVLDEPAAPRPDVPLAQLWQQRRQQFWSGLSAYPVRVRVSSSRRDDVAGAALAVEGTADPPPGDDGWTTLDLVFADRAHAAGVLWGLGPEATVVTPAELRAQLAGRAAGVLAGYGEEPGHR
jgi:predicted DNA-binding transcriptional regulator YafY